MPGPGPGIHVFRLAKKDVLVWTAPRHRVPNVGSLTTNRRPSVTELKLIAMDTSKHVFTLHGVDAQGKALLRRELRRQQLEACFGKLASTGVVLEACCGLYHWERMLT